MRLYIPEIKDQIKLTKDWKFTLYPERRNAKFGIKLGHAEDKGSTYSTLWGGEFREHDCFTWNPEKEKLIYHLLFSVTLEKDTILQIDRIYIRKGNKDYSSISFYIKSGPYKGARFWAKLTEVNTIEFENV